jgi:hypothetical protein
MANLKQNVAADPRHHISKIRKMLDDVAQHARADVGKVTDPKAQALFETTAEVLTGLAKAYEHAEHKTEAAWQ